ncbi:MAG: rRNA maturation RNase YbeY [Candidatus Omnitrophica bacterium]|nr:rRNA maturation RNase YbeY [Candidatus Omnitrophota bacterium]
MPPRNNGNSALAADIKRILRAAGSISYDLSVVFLTGPQMRALNRRALGHDHVTDVITFDLGTRGKRLEGEIYICPAEARRNAREYGEPFERELLRYVAHGILHLLGYDDATAVQREQMSRQEDILLQVTKK